LPVDQDFTSLGYYSMPSPLPSKRDCFYILELLETGLINFRYTHPWAECLIDSLDKPPSWLGELAVKTYHGD